MPTYIRLAKIDNWLTFTTTNLTVPPGSTDGVYTVHVGLRGPQENAWQTWEEYAVTLDRVAPVLTITNPILVGGSATVIKPYLQLQGFASKQLSGLSYDITNAFGLATNQDAFVTDQYFDMNKFDFTTNFFQAYDVPLTNGMNALTLRMTDLAGNMTTTNFNVVLDYTTATNPPVMNVIWPQDGMLVSGTSMTLRGTMSDETGTIQAQVVDGDGNTNAVTGLVERNGMFWVEDLPLGNGDNTLTVTATDAAGNMTTTNLTVSQSDLILTIDGTPTGDDLWHGSGYVSGRVGDPNATVIINGTNAVVDGANADGTYNWTATGVPIYGMGTATFDAVAYPGGSSGSSKAMILNASTPAAPPANASLAVEMQPYVALMSYNATEFQETKIKGSDDRLYYRTDKNQSAKPVAGPNGQWILNDRRTNDFVWYEHSGSWLNYGEEKYMWSISSPDEVEGLDGPTQWPPWDENLEMLQSFPHEDIASIVGNAVGFVHHYYADEPTYHWDFGGGGTFDLSLKARTQMKLFTGGKGLVSRRNLFEIDASATEIPRPPSNIDASFPWENPGVSGSAVDSKSLMIDGKMVGADGKLWVGLPDNSDMDLTVVARGKHHYNANATATKYKLNILVNGTTPLQPDRIVPNAYYCVGQKLTFSPYWLPNDPPYISSSSFFHWHLPGEFVNEPSVYQTYFYPAYARNDDLLAYKATYCWYLGKVDAGTSSIGMNLHFQNGQNASVAAVGKYNIHRPTIRTPLMQQQSGFSAFPTYLYYTIPALVGNMRWSAIINSDYDGYVGVTQLIKGNTSPYNTLDEYWLDGRYEIYGEPLGSPNEHSLKPYIAADSSTHFTTLDDHPQATVDVLIDTGCVTMNAHFKDYVRFMPIGDDSIFVTLGIVNWYMDGYACFPSSVTQDDLPPATGPVDSTAFPQWSSRFPQ